jgi:hypothetical protein
VNSCPNGGKVACRRGDISRASIGEAEELRFQGFAASEASRRRVQSMSPEVTRPQKESVRRAGLISARFPRRAAKCLRSVRDQSRSCAESLDSPLAGAWQILGE